MEEIWKEHPVYEGYEGSNLGNMRSWRAKHEGFRRINPFVLTPRITKSRAYPTVCIYFQRRGKTVFVHRFIAECFIHNPDNKPEVNHKNGIKTDNNPDNLEWVTISENHLHAYKLRLNDKRGEKHHLHKLTDENVINIRSEYCMGEVTQQQLAEKYGVTYSTIGMVISGKRWSHLPGAQLKDKRVWRRRLSFQEIRDIRRRFTEGEKTKADLSREYKVSFATIFEILKGNRYREVV